MWYVACNSKTQGPEAENGLEFEVKYVMSSKALQVTLRPCFTEVKKSWGQFHEVNIIFSLSIILTIKSICKG